MLAILRRDLALALKARDRVAIGALRSALAAIENAQAAPAGRPVPPTAGSEHVAGSVAGLGAAEAERRHLTEHDQCRILETEVRERSAAALAYEQAGRTDLAERVRSEADVLGRYLSRRRTDVGGRDGGEVGELGDGPHRATACPSE